MLTVLGLRMAEPFLDASMPRCRQKISQLSIMHSIHIELSMTSQCPTHVIVAYFFYYSSHRREKFKVEANVKLGEIRQLVHAQVWVAKMAAGCAGICIGWGHHLAIWDGI